MRYLKRVPGALLIALLAFLLVLAEAEERPRSTGTASVTHDRMLFWLCLAAGFVCAVVGG